MTVSINLATVSVNLVTVSVMTVTVSVDLVTASVNLVVCNVYRPHLTENGKMEQRMLKVAVLCGGLSVRDGTPLWKHDVIVTTAG